MRHAAALILFTLLIAASTLGADLPPNDLSFLFGNWTGSGSGDPGKGTGSFSFTSELQGRVVVRRAHSEYPAAGKAPIVHDDLLIVYAETSKAIYFDNEGHVIHYDVTADPKAHTIVFLSTDASPSPLFRLTYTQRPGDKLEVSFEISPSGKLSDLKPYLVGTATREKSQRQ